LPEIVNIVDAGAADAPAGSANAPIARRRVTEDRTRGFMDDGSFRLLECRTLFFPRNCRG
jgi:hypothetical protein